MYKACGLEIAVYETFEHVKNQLPVIQAIKKYFVINENWMMILNKQQSRSDDNETPLLPLKELEYLTNPKTTNVTVFKWSPFRNQKS